MLKSTCASVRLLRRHARQGSILPDKDRLSAAPSFVGSSLWLWDVEDICGGKGWWQDLVPTRRIHKPLGALYIEQLRIVLPVLVELVVVLTVHDRLLRVDAPTRRHLVEEIVRHLVQVLAHPEMTTLQSLLPLVAQMSIGPVDKSGSSGRLLRTFNGCLGRNKATGLHIFLRKHLWLGA